MNRKKELKQLYKETEIEGGIYCIRNIKNEKVYVESTRNFKTMSGRRLLLNMGSHTNKALQDDWKEYGADVFEFEILEVLKKKETGYFNEKEELKKLEEKWLEKLQPFGERGYNRDISQ
ncbi:MULTISPECIES: GIY-YIG nuclease family protein [unclassified Bacillus (in: firmicutes)]|uniref:GIY-YIG nuclease family protein n=1 Tax=unclassified Bacillus (in: firmicutes) TaxID=185979 RepID=UPI00232DED9F|nr:GIY-YIG nuclease family protein [Bacillus sp. BP-3]MDC2865826.1 GIY-YIG nuclease family protein [Bacillus sp. BP-3]